MKQVLYFTNMIKGSNENTSNIYGPIKRRNTLI